MSIMTVEKKEQVSAYNRAYHIAHPEKWRVYNKEWYEKNKLKVLQRAKQWRDTHREEAAVICKRYREKNLDKEVARRKRYYERNKTRLDASAVKADKQSRDTLSNRYIRRVLCLPIKSAPPELIELKREHLKNIRVYRKLKQTIGVINEQR